MRRNDARMLRASPCLRDFVVEFVRDTVSRWQSDQNDDEMKILYCASDQTVPGTKGGSVHVTAVAEGLAALGHEVHALVTPGGVFPAGPVRWIAMPPPLGRKELRWASAGAVRRLAADLRPDVIMERYYNFGGEGIGAAARVGATAVLEVNAPVIDFPGSAKGRLDRALLVEPMRRWREGICARADVIVTPSCGNPSAGHSAVEGSRARVGC